MPGPPPVMPELLGMRDRPAFLILAGSQAVAPMETRYER